MARHKALNGSKSPLALQAPVPCPSAQAVPQSRLAHTVLALAALLWVGQAASLAVAVQRLADGQGWAAVTGPALAYALLGMARATGEAWAGRRIFAAARRYVSAARAEACAALARRSPLDGTRATSGQAASAMAEQAEALLPWLLRYQPARWRTLVMPPVLALAVASQSWLAALILVAAAPLIPLAMALVGWQARAASESQLQALGGMNGFLLDRLRGLATLRALGAVDATARRLRASAETLRQRTMRVLRIAFLSSASLELFSALAVALVAVYVGFHLLGQFSAGSWGQRLSLGQGLFVLLLAPAFFEPLRDLAAAWHDKAAGQAALQALQQLQAGDALRLPGALDEPPLRPDAPRAASVELRAVGLQHAGEAPVLAGVDLFVGAGEQVALVGASGAGKTTLLSLIAGLLPASSGEVLIDGTRLEEASAAALRRRMAWIGQKPHIFSGTALDNVSLDRPGVLRRHAAAALRHAGLGDASRIVPGSALGEGGTGLSGGEAVRLALARAAAAGSADLWLLDEPTAHLDSATAQAVVDALLRMARGRTLIVATHDLALAARIGRVVHIGQLGDAAPRRAA